VSGGSTGGSTDTGGTTGSTGGRAGGGSGAAGVGAGGGAGTGGLDVGASDGPLQSCTCDGSYKVIACTIYSCGKGGTVGSDGGGSTDTGGSCGDATVKAVYAACRAAKDSASCAALGGF
jgi:hypothetical protein